MSLSKPEVEPDMEESELDGAPLFDNRPIDFSGVLAEPVALDGVPLVCCRVVSQPCACTCMHGSGTHEDVVSPSFLFPSSSSSSFSFFLPLFLLPSSLLSHFPEGGG